MKRLIGGAAGGTLALALLVCGCVFIAMAGPALSLHARSQALQQTISRLPGVSRVVQVNASWGQVLQELRAEVFDQNLNLSEATLEESASELAAGLAATPLPLAAGRWTSLYTNPLVITSPLPARARGGAPSRMEILYRQPFTSYAQVVAGSYATGPAPPGAVAVAATTQTAARFGLHPGSRMTVGIPGAKVTLLITAIVRERAPGSTFWAEDSLASQPGLQAPSTHRGLPYWEGGVIAEPGQLPAMQREFGSVGMELSWEFPLNVGGLNADQAQGLSSALNRATSVAPTLSGPLAAAADSLAVSSPLVPVLSQFLSAQTAIMAVLLLLFVSLIVVGAAVILLAARMIVARRAGELTMLRARGASIRQVAAAVARGTLIAAVPAALLGAGLAIAVTPGDARWATPASWWLAGIAVAAALAGPPLIAAWQHRRPAPARNPARITATRSRAAWRRPVAEVTAIAASIAGLIVLHDQGASGADLYLTVTPVLVAVPVVLVMLRLYPLAVRGLLALAARRTGATGFVALSGAARSSLTGVLPAFGLVLALSLATFAGMLSQAITRGEIAASWQATGADAVINAEASPARVTPATLKAIAAVPGVHRVTAVWSTSWLTSIGQPVTAIAVDPAGYAALVADTPFPAVAAAELRPSTSVIPVLASPSAASMLGRDAAQLTSQSPVGPITVRVAGTLSSTPAVPGGGDYLIMPLQTLPGSFGQPDLNVVLVTGSSIDEARLSAVADKLVPGNGTTFRGDVLASLRSSPLKHGATLVITLTVVAAAAFGLFIIVLGVALGSTEREMTLARLAVMGHERSTWLVMAEALPAVMAAIVAGAACAVALPRAIGSSIDLSAFTGTTAPVRFQADATALGLFAGPAAAVVVLAVALLAWQARVLRHRDVTGVLRTN